MGLTVLLIVLVIIVCAIIAKWVMDMLE